MEIRNLLTFLKVAELENFTHAAEQLGYVQSTVTMQIQQLEAELGVPLFDRIGKKIALTQTGRELIFYANQITQLSQQAAALGKTSDEIRGVLRLGAVESLFTWELSDLIPIYRARFPHVAIEITIASGQDLVASLNKSELDAIFILNQNISEPDLVRVLAKPVQLVFVANPQSRLAGRKSIALRELVAEPLVLTERRGIYRKALENITLGLGLELSPVIEANNTGTIVRLLKQTPGVSFLPEFAVRDSIAQNELTLLPVKDCDIHFWCQLFHHKNKWVTPPMHGFIDLLDEHYRSRP